MPLTQPDPLKLAVCVSSEEQLGQDSPVRLAGAFWNSLTIHPSHYPCPTPEILAQAMPAFLSPSPSLWICTLALLF